MLSLLRKEINGFLSSVTGYVVVGVFLIITGLFIWIFPGEMNIPENGYATLDGLFIIAPWVFLFLVPAISMRMLSEEKKTGTIELLLTRPLSDMQIVFSKYLATVVLIVLSIVPTFIYFISVYKLGNPVGNIDIGATWGSYIGLFFLACIYASIGIFSSSLTDNQIISFLIAVLVSFLMFTGFDYAASIFETSSYNTTILNLGINEHYKSISRGVIDSREIIYFLSVSLFFLLLTKINVRNKNGNFFKILFSKGGEWIVLMFVALILLNYASSYYFARIDLTSDKRFTLAKPTKKYLKSVEDVVYIKIYLDGDLPIGFNKLKRSIRETLDEFRIYSDNIEYNFVNLYDIDDIDERNDHIKELYQKGVMPVNVRIKSDDGLTQKNIFPGAIISYQNAEVGINLLSNNPGLPDEVNLNNSEQNLEYNLISIIKNITSAKVERIAFIEGHGELDEYHVEDVSRALAHYYQIDRGTINGQMGILDPFKAIIIAKPQKPFSEADKFVIDQYIMNGGKVLWFVDPVNANSDSLVYGSTVAFIRDLNIDDLLFNYGVRINPVLVKDLQSNFLLINTAIQGNNPKWEPVPWYYNPLISGRQEHPITKNLNMILTEFVSCIDTLDSNGNVKKTKLLWTSEASAIQNVPAYIMLDEVTKKPDRKEYSEGPKMISVLLEGKFQSYYKGRMIESIIGYKPDNVLYESKETAMLVVADGDIIKNDVVHTANGTMIAKLGYDKNTKQTFGNKEFILNAVNYLTDEDGLIKLRSREYQLRLLDMQKLKSKKNLIVALNLILPILLIVIYGILSNFLRKRRYS